MSTCNIKQRLLLAFILFLSGCSLQRAQDARDAKVQMVGMTKDQVFACMGPPTQKATEGKTEIWSYNSGNGRVDAFATANTFGSAAATQNGNTINASGNTFGVASGIQEKRFCVVNLVMNNKHVSAVNFIGPTGGILTQGEQCAYAVANCIHHN